MRKFGKDDRPTLKLLENNKPAKTNGEVFGNMSNTIASNKVADSSLNETNNNMEHGALNNGGARDAADDYGKEVGFGQNFLG